MGKKVLEFLSEINEEVLLYHLRNLLDSFPRQLFRVSIEVTYGNSLYDPPELMSVTFSSSVFNLAAPLRRLYRQVDDYLEWLSSDDPLDPYQLHYKIFINHKLKFNDYVTQKQKKKPSRSSRSDSSKSRRFPYGMTDELSLF